MTLRGDLPRQLLPWYIAAQLLGALMGAWLAHAMFGLSIVQTSVTVRSGFGQWLAEGVATFGLLLVILRAPASRVAAMVAAYIGAAYWFTASTSFANPAAAFGRMWSNTFAGIAPSSVPAFVVAEVVGALLAVAVHWMLTPATSLRAPSATTAHGLTQPSSTTPAAALRATPWH